MLRRTILITAALLIAGGWLLMTLHLTGPEDFWWRAITTISVAVAAAIAVEAMIRDQQRR